MKDIFTITKFTAKDMLGRKSFRVSTIIIMLLIIVGCNIPNFLNALGVNDFNTKVQIVDQSNIFEDQLNPLTTADTGYDIIIENADFDAIKTKISNGEIDAAIIITNTDSQPNLQYLVKNAAVSGTIPQDLLNLLNATYQNLQLNKLHLTPAQLASITTPLNVEIFQVDEQEISGNILAMMMLSIVLFYAIYFCAFQVSSSITVEKTSKIIETLVTSTKPRNIIIGKTLGIGLVGLLQMLIIVGTAIISAYAFLDRAIIDAIFDVSQLTFGLALVSIIYFILGYALYAFAYALTGSTVNKPEDIQSANTPIALITMIGFYLAYFTLTDPTSNINVFAAIFPISSPFCMPIRVIMGLASPIEIIISITVLLIAILIVAHIAIKIYSNAILNYGTKLSLGELRKLYKNK